jgi:hypothetical protein
MPHHHDHDHDRGHSHAHGPESGSLSFEDKMEKLLNHWIQHNADHAASYKEWAAKAETHGHGALADKLQDAARASLSMNEIFESAAKLVRKP